MLQLLALGDSYTIGESVPEAERWPVQLVAMLVKRGLTLEGPILIAQTGWTTDELAAAIDQRKPAGPFRLVTLMVGVNNQYRGRDPENYRQEFRSLLDRATGFTAGHPDRVIVLSIPDWGVTPFAAGKDRREIAAAIDRFNRINQEEASRAGARYVNVTPISRRAAGEPGLVADDGLHPSGEMYRLWAEKVLPEAIAALK